MKTTVTSGEGGKLKVSEGTLSFNPVSDGGSLQADIEMAGGALSGNLVLGRDVKLSVTKASGLGANITTGGHAVTFDTQVAATYSNTISGDGALVKTGAAELTFAEDAVISGNDLSVQQGVVTIKRNATDGKSFGTVQLANGTTLKQYNAKQPTTFSEMNTLVVGSSATLQEDNHSGAWKVNTLELAEGTTSATLNLTSSSSSSVASVYELGEAEADGGNFAGNIILKSTNASNTRSAVLQISNGEIAAKTRVNLLSTGANNNNQKLGFGVNAERVTIAGLDSGEALGARALVFSGRVNPNTNTPAYTGDNTIRTLAIDTAAGTEAHFRGTVGKSLNIEKSGEGTQTFSGASSAFNGKISAVGGTLALKGDAVGMLNGGGDVELRGGSVSINDSLTLSATAGREALLQGGSVQFSAQGTEVSLRALSQGVEMSNTIMELAASATLRLDDIMFSSSSRLEGAGSAVVANGVIFAAVAGENAFLTSLPQPMLLGADSGSSSSEVGILTLTNIINVTLSGSDIMVDISSFREDELSRFSTLGISLGEEASFAPDSHVSVMYGGNNILAAFREGENGTVFLNMSHLMQAPEPATATLSLLALTALAARRRRLS